jgi:chromosome segregation ATPase
MDYAKEMEIIEKASYMKADVGKYDKRIEKKQEELSKYQERKLHLYEDYKEGILDKQEYMMFKTDYDKKIETAARELEAFEADKRMILDNENESQAWIEEFKKVGQMTELTRNAVAILIDKVMVYSSDRVEIRYRFENAFAAMKKYVDAYSTKNYSESEAV